jgi:5-methylcytosine-specific restriction endonuclease McrA
MKYCIVCNNNIKSRKKEVQFCSSKCQHEHSNTIKVQQWLNGEISGMKKGARIINAVRSYILDKAEHQCEVCGWNKINPITGRSPLEINHIDGDAGNNRPENLQVICPNCHSLTPTWKALNKGKGNKERLRYSGLGKQPPLV